MSKTQFRDLVETVFLQFLVGCSFHFEDVSTTNFGMEYVIYGAKKIKLKFYRDLRNGEINCMVHLDTVDDTIKTSQQSEQYWKYLPELCEEENNKTVEELLQNVPSGPLSDMEQLSRLKAMIERNLPKIIAVISN